MPIKISNNLSATKILKDKNVFVIDKNCQIIQKVRSLKLLILNIMPTEIITESQLLRLLSDTHLQIEMDWIHMESHQFENISKKHLLSFYRTFEDVKNN